MNADSITVDETKAVDGACNATSVDDILNSLFVDNVTGLYVKNAFSALLKLLRSRDGAVQLHRACGELTVMAMLRTKASVAVVQSYGFVLMRKLSCVCMESNHIFVDNGAVGLAADALRRFPNDTILQASACGALLPFVKYAAPGSTDALLSSGILPLLVRLLLFQTDQHPSQITIYACLVLAEVCDQRGQPVIDQVRQASLAAGDDEWMFLHASLTNLKASLRNDDDRKLSCAVSTFVLCLMSMDRVVTKVVEELGGIPVVSSVMVKYANDAGILKYSDIVCQQLAKAASPSPKKAKHSSKSTKSGKSKARPVDGVVYDVQLPAVTPSPLGKDIPAAVEMTQNHIIKENKVISAYGFAPSKQPGETKPRSATSRVRPSPSDPSLPSLDQASSTGLKHAADAKRPSRPVKHPGSGSPKRPSPPKTFLAPPTDAPPSLPKKKPSPASPQAKKGGQSVTDAAPRSPRAQPVSVRQTSEAVIDSTLAAKRPPARSSSVGVSPRLATPKVVADQAWADPTESTKHTTSPPRPSPPKVAPAAPTGHGISVFRFRHTVDASCQPVPVEAKDSVASPSPANDAPATSSSRPPPAEASTAIGSSEPRGHAVGGQVEPRDDSLQSFFAASSEVERPVPTAPTHPPLTPSNTLVCLAPPTDCASQANDVDAAKAIVKRPVPFTPANSFVDASRSQPSFSPKDVVVDNATPTPRRYDPITPSNTFVGDLPSPHEEPPVDLDQAIADLVLCGSMGTTAHSPKRFVPLTPANTFVGLDELGLNREKFEPCTPRQAVHVSAVLATDEEHDVVASLLASQLDRSWVYDGIVSTCDQHVRSTDLRQGGASGDDLLNAPTNDDSLDSDGNVQHHSRPFASIEGDADSRIPQPFPTLPQSSPALEEYDVALARTAKQLVHLWLYDTLDRLVSQTLVLPPEVISSPLCGLALDDDSHPNPIDGKNESFASQIQELEKLEQTTPGESAIERNETGPGALDEAATEHPEPRDVCVETAKFASQLVRGWTSDAIDRLVSAAGQPVVEVDVHLVEDTASLVSASVEAAVPSEDPADFASQPDQGDEEDALSVQVSMVASQLVRGWVYSCMDHMIQVAVTTVQTVSTVPVVPLELAPTTGHAPILAPTPPAEEDHDDHLAVHVSLVAAQLVQSWIYDTLDRVTQFSTRRHEHDPPSPSSPDAARDAIDLDEPPADDGDTWSVASSVLAHRLVQTWIYETLERVTQFSTPRHDPHHDHSPPPISRDEFNRADEVVDASVDEALESHELDSVQVAMLARQVVTVWIFDTIDRLAQSRGAVETPADDDDYARDDDFADQGHESMADMAAVYAYADDEFDLPRDESPSRPDEPLPPVSGDDTSSDAVSIVVSMLAHQLVQSWVYDTIERTCASLMVESEPLANADLTQEDRDSNKAPTRLSQDQEGSTALSVAASVLAAQLVKSWIFITLDDVVRLTTRPVEHSKALPHEAPDTLEHPHPPAASTIERAAVDGPPSPHDRFNGTDNDEDCHVLASLVADQMSKAWIFEAVLNVTNTLVPPLGLTPSMANVLFIDDGTLRQGNLPPILFFDEGELRHADSCDSMVVCVENNPPDDELVGVEVSLLAAQLVRGWIYSTMAEVLQFSAPRPNGHALAITSPSPIPHVVHAFATAKNTLDEEAPTRDTEANEAAGVEADDAVAISLMAKQLVHGWTYESLMHVADLTLAACAQKGMVTTLEPVILDACKTKTDEADDEMEDRSVAVSFFAGQLVRLWLYETMDTIVRFSSRPAPHNAHLPAHDPSSPAAPDSPPRSIVEATFIDTTRVPEAAHASHDEIDSTSDMSLDVVLLANILVRAWTTDAIVNVLERWQPRGWARECGQDVVGSRENDTIGIDRLEQAQSAAVDDFPLTSRTDVCDDVSLEVVLLANLLVRAWTGEAMLRVMYSADTARRTVLSDDAEMGGYDESEFETPSEVHPLPASADEEADVASSSRSPIAHASIQVVLLANLLVRAWTCDAMMRIIDATREPELDVPAVLAHRDAPQEDAHRSLCEVDEAAPEDTIQGGKARKQEATSFALSPTIDQDDVSLEIVLLANLFVRAWVSEAMLRVLDASAAASESQTHGSFDPKARRQVEEAARPASPLWGPPPVETISDCRANSTVATTSSDELVRDPPLEVVLLSSLLVRAWLAEATMNAAESLATPHTSSSMPSALYRDATKASSLEDVTIPFAPLPASEVELSHNDVIHPRAPPTVVPANVKKAPENDLTPIEDDNATLEEVSLDIVLLANLLVRAWVSEAVVYVVSMSNGTTEGSAEDDLVLQQVPPLVPQTPPVAAPTMPSIDYEECHIAAIFTKWNSGDVTHESFRRLEGVYLRGAACVEDWVRGYVAVPVASAVAQVGNARWQSPGGRSDDGEYQVAIALLAAQMTRCWIFEALFNVSNKQLHKLLDQSLVVVVPN